jgi:AcrR family transcriptional regulator
MPRTKEQNEAMREATREKIHSAAVKLFSVKGFAATGVQEIADAAGISIGLLYRHYKTKDEIFGALVTEAIVGLEQNTKLFESDIPPADIVRMLTEEIINDLTHSDEFMQYMLLLTQPFFTGENSPWMKNVLKQDLLMFHQFGRVIEKGQALGQFKGGDPDKMAQYYFAVFQGLCMMKHFLKEAFNPPTAELMTAFLFEEDIKSEAK